MENGRKLQYVVTCAVSLVTSTMGFLDAWPTCMIRKIWDGETDFQFDDEDMTWFYKLATIGLLVGTVFAGYICDRFGRRTTLLTAIVISAFGSIFAAISSASWMLHTMQFLWSFSFGIVWNVGNIYMAEVIDPDLRGGLTLATRFMFYFGSVLMLWIGPAVSYRALNGWILVPPLFSFAAIYPIPESPYYLLIVGKDEQAKRELSRLQENVSSENIDVQFEKMKTHVTLEMKNPSSLFKLLTNKRYRKALIITLGLRIIYFLSGAVAMQGFFLTILIEGHIQLNPGKMVDIGVAIQFVIGIFGALLVDRVGRRKLLLWSFIGSTVSMSVIGLYFVVRDYYTPSVQAIGYVTFAAIIIFLISISLGSIKDLLEVELFPLNVRTKAVITLYMFRGLGYPLNIAIQEFQQTAGRVSVFWTFVVVACVGYIFTYFLLPETKCRDLKAIQGMLFDDGRDQEMTSNLENTEVFRQRVA